MCDSQRQLALSEIRGAPELEEKSPFLKATEFKGNCAAHTTFLDL